MLFCDNFVLVVVLYLIAFCNFVSYLNICCSFNNRPSNFCSSILPHAIVYLYHIFYYYFILFCFVILIGLNTRPKAHLLAQIQCPILAHFFNPIGMGLFYAQNLFFLLTHKASIGCSRPAVACLPSQPARHRPSR